MIKLFFKWFFRGFVSVGAVLGVAVGWLFVKLISVFGAVVSAAILLAIFGFIMLVLYSLSRAKQEYAMKSKQSDNRPR